MEQVLWTLEQTAEAMNLRLTLVKRMVGDGRIPSVKVGRKRMCDPDAIKALLKGSKLPTLPETDPSAELERSREHELKKLDFEARKSEAEAKIAVANRKVTEPQEIEALKADIKKVGDILKRFMESYGKKVETLEALPRTDERLEQDVKELASLMVVFIRLLREKPRTAVIVKKVEKQNPDYLERMHMRADMGGRGDSPAWNNL